MKPIDKIKNVLNFISTIVLIIMVLYLTIGAIFIIRNNIDYLEYSLYLSFFCIPNLILYLLFKILNKEGIKAKDIIIVLLCIIGYISYKNALDPTMALVGTYGRNEGLKVIYTYYTVFLLASTIPKKNQRVVMIFVLLTGFFQIILGTIQTIGIKEIFGYSRINNFSTNFNFASGTFGNPNFYSTYILLCFLYIFGLLLKDNKIKNKIIYVLFSVVFAYGLIIGNTMSCILAAGIVIFMSIITRVNKNNFKKVGLTFFLFLIGTLISLYVLDNCLNHRLTRTIRRNADEIVDVFENGLDDSTGNYRIYVWKETLKHVPKNIYNGIGIDNFSLINSGTYICVGDYGKKQCFDKAHNEYLQLLITEGIFALIIYILLIIFTIFQFFRNRKFENKTTYGIFSSFIGYLIQAFLNISVITVAPLFYVIMGFLHFEEEDKKQKKGEPFIDMRIKVIVIAIFVLLIVKCIIALKLA